MQVNNITVIGSGVMGSGIAAQAANAGFNVLLLDIVPKDAQNRNQLAEEAIAKQLKTGGFAHEDCAKNITAGNLEDDLDALAQADWIIEVVVEKVKIKHDVYQKINAARKKGSIVSSNTSTIPLKQLIEGMPEGFKADFMISHFFNPPRQMRLIEMVPSQTLDGARYQAICEVATTRLGKTVVHCKDTPGFIANRIGIYWMTLAMNEAMAQDITVETADALLSKPIGVPKTGVFGLYDLIGIDLMPLIASAMIDYVGESDPYNQLEAKPDLLKRMIEDGYTGRKGKGGFYKMQKLDDGGKLMQTVDLSTGEYHPTLGAQTLDSAKAKDIKTLLSADDIGGAYSRSVMIKTLYYAASLLGEIADDMHSIDTAMRYGYSWKYGPFELIDQIGTKAFAEYCKSMNFSVPPIIKQASGEPLYKQGKQLVLAAPESEKQYKPVPRPAGMLKLSDHGDPLKTYASAKLWDLGDDVFCLELTSKMHVIDNDGLDAIEAALDYTKTHGKALVIGSEESYFSAGANLNFFLEGATSGELDKVDALIARGQQVMQRIKYSDVPVIPAVTGIALGGACELMLHAAAVQPHLECRTGLVEIGVGVVPAWGGCTQMLVKRVMAQSGDQAKISALSEVFANIVQMKTANSAYQAKDLGVVNADASITMNLDLLLADAKAQALQMVGHSVKKPASIILPVGSEAALKLWLDTHLETLSPHSKHIAKCLIEVLTLAEGSAKTEQEIMDKEREIFIELLATKPTQDRIEAMLKTGKPLAN